VKASFIYFVRAVSGDVELGPIKVGYATNLKRRLKQLQACSPFPLKVLKAVVGGFDMESDFHREYREWNTHGEWIEATPKLLAHIERLVGGVEVKPQSYAVKPRTKNWKGY